MPTTQSFIFSPPGIAVWPKLNEPDYKFDKEAGSFSVKLRLDPTDAVAGGFLDDLKQRYESEYEEKCSVLKKKTLKRGPTPWSVETDDDDEETGMVLLKFGMKHRIPTKSGRIWERRPELFNAQLEPTNELIGGGSELIIKTEPYFWYTPGLGFGLSLQPLAVQVVRLCSSEGVGAEGFTPVPLEATDGFTAAGTGEDEDY